MLKNFKWFRRLEGGYWVKTKYRGWMDKQTHQTYLKYGWDPIVTEEEYYKSSTDIQESEEKNNRVEFVDVDKPY
jgi:hypothetical protein